MIYTNSTVTYSTNIYWAHIMSQELRTEQKTWQKQSLVFWSQINDRRARLTKIQELIFTNMVAAAPERYIKGMPRNLRV